MLIDATRRGEVDKANDGGIGEKKKKKKKKTGRVMGPAAPVRPHPRCRPQLKDSSHEART